AADFAPQKLAEAAAHTVHRNPHRDLADAECGRHIGVAARLTVAFQVRLQMCVDGAFAGVAVLLLQAARGPFQCSDRPVPLIDLFGGFRTGRSGVKIFGSGHLFGTEETGVAAALPGVSGAPLIGEEIAQSGQQKGAELTERWIDVPQVVFFEEARKKTLREILRILNGAAGAPDVGVERAPIGGTELLHSGIRRVARTIARSQNDAPVRRGETRGVVRLHGPDCTAEDPGAARGQRTHAIMTTGRRAMAAEITELLQRVRNGDREACEELVPLV